MVVCLFRQADAECLCQVCSQLQCIVLCFVLFVMFAVNAIGDHIVDYASTI